MKTNFFRQANNRRGLISADFIFSLAIFFGVCIVLFAFTFTLSMVEVAQYITFSAARAHAAGHKDQSLQEEMGKKKYNQLVNNSVLVPLFSQRGMGWFTLSKPDIRGAGKNNQTFRNDYPGNNRDDRVPAVGARISFESKLLHIKIPILGETFDDSSGNGYAAQITAFLIREPNQDECWNLQVKERYRAILNLDPRFKDVGSSTQNKYAPMEDNGC